MEHISIEYPGHINLITIGQTLTQNINVNCTKQDKNLKKSGAFKSHDKNCKKKKCMNYKIMMRYFMSL